MAKVRTRLRGVSGAAVGDRGSASEGSTMVTGSSWGGGAVVAVVAGGVPMLGGRMCGGGNGASVLMDCMQWVGGAGCEFPKDVGGDGKMPCYGSLECNA